MSMPKGHKMENGYFTVSKIGGKGFRQIAQTLTSEGDKMNQATARNVFLRGLKKVAIPVANLYPDTNREIDDIVKDPRFQMAVFELLKDSS